MISTPILTFLLITLIPITLHQSNAQSPQASPPLSSSPTTISTASAPTGPTMAKPELLTKGCETQYKDLCTSFLGNFPESEVKDMHDLAKFAIKMVSLNATKTHEEIIKMEATAADDITKQKLDDCGENYQDVVDQLEDSLPALDSKAYDDVITFVTAAMNDVQSCEDGFKQPPAAKSPLSETNDVVTKLCNICLSITNMVGK